MMAMEGSLLGCASDDWSVDSEYAFKDFAEDLPKVRPISAPDLGRFRAELRGGQTRFSDFSDCSAEAENVARSLTSHRLHDTGALDDGEYFSLDGLRQDSSQPRLIEDPGSSTDSLYILRLEQRMFLKV